MMMSLYHTIRLSSLLLVLLKSDISAFLSRPLWSQASTTFSDGTISYRKPLITWSVTNGPPQLIIDNSRQIQEIAVQRKMEKKDSSSSKTYSFQRSSGTTSTGLWEAKLRKAIVTKQWDDASNLLKNLNSTKLASGRDVVYVITETSRRSQNLTAIIPLLSSVKKLERGFDYTTENDIMPLLFDCSKTNSISAGYRIVSWLYNRNVKFSAKTYSVLLKGYGLQRNEQMVDRILLECAKYGVQPDTVLLNGAIDAYIRCDNPQKAIDLFDAVISGANNNINSDKKLYSNREKNDMLEISKAFTNRNLRPNIRTYNTVLKALRGYTGFEKCMDVIRMMKASNISPDSVTMNTLIDSAVVSGNLEIAEDLIKHPMAAPGVEAYTAIISGYAGEGNVIEAFRILTFMISKGIQPNSYTLTALMKTCVTKGDWERARELLTIGNEYSFSAKSLAPSPGSIKLAPSSAPYLTLKELAVLHGSYVIGLCSLALSSEDLDDKEIYLKEAQFELISMEEKKLKPDTATMNAFIQALCAMQPARVTDALLILRAMKIDDIGPDDYTYSILFTALGKEGYIDEALQLFRSTEKHMDTPALNSLLRAFIGGPNPLQAIQIYQEMISSNSSIIEHGQFVPSKYTFTILYLAISRSVSPQKFASKLSNSFDDSKVKDRRMKPRPLRYLTSSRSIVGQQVGAGGNSTSGDVVVDTTMRNIPPPMQALSVLGEVIKSIGSKLNARKSNLAGSETPYEIQGVYGNYVSSSFDDDMERKKREAEASTPNEKENSQPLVYDDNSGRFFEATLDKKMAGSDVVNTVPGLASMMRSAKQVYTSEDIFESDDPRDSVEKYGKYGPPDNLDLLREIYPKDLEAKIKARQAKNTLIPKELAIEAGQRASSNDLMSMTPDALLQKLFLSMRFEHNIEADEIMISALNSLFSNTNHFDQDRDDMYTTTSYDGYKPSTPTAVTLGWAKKSGLSKKTAELVFADLVISGWHPSMFQPILYSCGYPQRQVSELLREEEFNYAVKKIRASAASIRIFKKHDWNNVESGWSSFFQ